MMYHWRVLPQQVKPLNAEDLKDLEKFVEYWGGSPVIRARLEAIQKSSATIILFLEHIPETVGMLLKKKFADGNGVNDGAQAAVTMVERDIKTVTSFMQSHGLLHFDAHFGNILTDGHRLYFADFGLAISSQFELSQEESNFFKNHRNYDRYEMTSILVNSMVSILFGRENRDAILHEYAAGKASKKMAPWAAAIITRYAPIAVVMNDFYEQLREHNKTTPFPASELERLSVAAGL